MIVQVWNQQAEELWGLREVETVGQHFLNLDSGLPTEHLKTLVREVIFDGRDGGEELLQAVNRRGRSVQLRVSATPLMSGDDQPSGALFADGADRGRLTGSVRRRRVLTRLRHPGCDVPELALGLL